MGILVSVYIVYNLIIYSFGTSNDTEKMSPLAIQGEQLYQENNCTACHQIFGLGGYLGPDLTNIVSNKAKGPVYVKALLNSGVKSMPQFHFNEEEKEALVQFLTEVDQCGYYPIVDAKPNASGWVDMKYKNQ